MAFETYQLGDICDFLDSMRVPISEELRKPGPYPYYGANGQQGWIDDYIFDEPLVLLAEDGGQFGSKTKPIAYKVSGKCWVNNHAHVLRVKRNCNIDYLHRILSFYDVTQYINGTTRAKLTKGNAESIPIPLPPLSEQKHIAAILEKADRLRRQRRHALHISDTFLQAVFLKMFGKYLIKDELKLQLGELVTITGGGTPSRENKSYFEGEIPWLTAKDMRGDYIFDTQEHINEEAIKKSATKLVPAGSILIVVKSKVLMHRLPIAIAMKKLCHGQDIKSIQCSNSINLFFLVYLLKYNEPHLLFRARGANTEGLILPMLEEIQVPDVSLSMQEEFASVVQTFDRLRTQQREAKRQAEHLFQTLLHRAFRGELTAQEPVKVVAFRCHDSVDDRGAILSYIVKSQWQQPTFGHVKCAKLVYWVSAHIGIDLGGEQWREAAGPLADFFYSLEEPAKEKGWFYVQKQDTGRYSYSLGPNISERVQAAIEILGERREKLDKLLEDLAGVKSDEIEAAATLFAAWNDFLIEGHKPSDDEIIREALENWHPDKKLKRLFNRLMLKAMLQWMREIKLTPEGIGPRTIKKM
jgi:type I restriction enzyme, S subunit